MPLKIVIRNGIRAPGNNKVWVKCSNGSKWGCASMTGRMAEEYIDDASNTAEVNALIVKDPECGA